MKIPFNFFSFLSRSFRFVQKTHGMFILGLAVVCVLPQAALAEHPCETEIANIKNSGGAVYTSDRSKGWIYCAAGFFTGADTLALKLGGSSKNEKKWPSSSAKARARLLPGKAVLTEPHAWPAVIFWVAFEVASYLISDAMEEQNKAKIIVLKKDDFLNRAFGTNIPYGHRAEGTTEVTDKNGNKQTIEVGVENLGDVQMGE